MLLAGSNLQFTVEWVGVYSSNNKYSFKLNMDNLPIYKYFCWNLCIWNDLNKIFPVLVKMCLKKLSVLDLQGVSDL